MSGYQNDETNAQKPAQRVTVPLWKSAVRALFFAAAVLGGIALGIVGYNVSGGTPTGFVLAFLFVIGYSLVLAVLDWLIFG